MPRNAIVETLEPRQLLHADLSVAIRSTTLPDALLAGVAAKPYIAQITVTNANTDGHATERNAPRLPVAVGLRNDVGEVFSLGSSQANIPNLKAGASRNIPVQLRIPTNLPQGNYTLVATIDPPPAFEDPNPDNNTAAGKAVSAAPANTDITLVVGSSVTGSVASGSNAQVRVTLTNAGNVASKASATLEITATIGDTTTVLATVPNLRLNLQPGKSFSSKPVTIRVPGNPAGTTPVTLGARIASATGLVNDNPANNAANGVTLQVQPPPPSPFTSVNNSVNLAGTITFRRTSRVGAAGNFIELGTFVDSNGRTGKYDYRITNLGTINAGIILSNDDDTPFMTGSFSSAIALGGKTVVFSTDSAGSIASFNALGTTFFARYGR